MLGAEVAEFDSDEEDGEKRVVPAILKDCLCKRSLLDAADL